MLAEAIRARIDWLPGPAAEELARALDPPGPSLADAIRRFERLVAWLRQGVAGELPADAPVPSASPAARLWTLLRLVEQDEVARDALGLLCGRILAEASLASALRQGGLARGTSLLGEVGDRLARRVLPEPPDDTDLRGLLERIFPDDASGAWYEQAPPRVLVALYEAVAASPAGARVRERLLADTVEAITLLAVQAAAIGLGDDVRARGPKGPASTSAWVALANSTAHLAAVVEDPAALIEAQRRATMALDAACAAYRVVAGRLDEGGISVDLVYRMELLDHALGRLRRLVALVDRGPEDGPDAVRLVRDLVRASLADRSVGALLARNSHLLARRIVERAGETAEHYITRDRDQWKAMVRSAAGGGVLTVGTAAAKVAIVGLHLPQAWEFGLSWLNYAGSFLLMQALHLTLATKQPAMTAAAIAADLGDEGHRADAFSELLARVARSQFAAALGNLGAAIPAAIVFGLAFGLVADAPFMGEEKAAHTLHALHPAAGGTLFYAALTGAVLWLGSVAGGAVENWTALHRLPEGLARSRRVVAWLGPARAAALGQGVARHTSGIATNVALGGLLAAIPVFGAFVGLPFDVRHVTLATASATLAVVTLQHVDANLAWALGGIACTLALNFGISFALALSVALRARGVPVGQLRSGLRAAARNFLRRPWSFLVP